MSKKNRIVRVRLIANPGAGDITTAVARIEQVTRTLLDFRLELDAALVKPRKEAIYQPSMVETPAGVYKFRRFN
ncbi:MAG: hypothetical protein HZB50_08805 [Chloroflexi bacterium]|nr:hypothetical protein [Chloroflexota bacterium]